MGRVSRWFKGSFGFKKSKGKQSCVSSDDSDKGGKDSSDSILLRTFSKDTKKEQNKQAVVVATATAAAAEAAVSAAVVRLTRKERVGDIVTREEHLAAVQIQKVFRGSLARKALRALRGIVKLQALVRGYLVRKRAAVMLQSIQALMRVQTSMRSKRTNRCLNKEYNNMFQPRHSFDKFDEAGYDERRSKIVEIGDMYKRRPSSKSKCRQIHNVVAMSEYEDDLVLSFSEEKRKFATAHNTPRFSFSTPKRAANNRYYVPQSPTMNICEDTLCDNGMSTTPGYMEKTQSFKAKLRAHSAPRQRFERTRLSLDEIIASRSCLNGVTLVQPEPQRYSCSYDPF